MAKTFLLEILTPEKTFFKGNVISVSLESTYGRVGILADHVPMVCSLSVGQIYITDDKGEHIAFHSEGFMDVTRQGVIVLSQACEWPEEIDAKRAQMALDRANERIANQNKIDEFNHSKLALTRAISRIQTREYASRLDK